MLRTILFIAAVPIVFWLATCAVIPNPDYSHAETAQAPAEPVEWRHTVDGWEPIEEIQVEPPVDRDPPIHPLTLLPLVVAVALSALLAFEPKEAAAVSAKTKPHTSGSGAKPHAAQTTEA
ncbi:hypothetical protein LOC68_15840 [Blastopirellula sp. JC732]|uniref:Uncharacterized protein n=1 Tax=Blastopirellula sediminis TaxID=2894196 RepID=A0A9X1SH93_9BACT|nr:hypothetical protein [Blastopirellula sediminis]MCC9606842.1 hypothetical protein [Blastopirellula sediminis]MCC9629862.1 hypothetical protein [Blastopirellula sediminis]